MNKSIEVVLFIIIAGAVGYLLSNEIGISIGVGVGAAIGYYLYRGHHSFWGKK